MPICCSVNLHCLLKDKRVEAGSRCTPTSNQYVFNLLYYLILVSLSFTSWILVYNVHYTCTYEHLIKLITILCV